jgi:hypothetical protein
VLHWIALVGDIRLSHDEIATHLAEESEEQSGDKVLHQVILSATFGTV